MRPIPMMLGAMCTGLFALLLFAEAGSDTGFTPLQIIELYGSPCRAQAHTVGDEEVAFACAFDPTLEAGIARVPEIAQEAVASFTLLERDVVQNTPVERHTLRVRVATLRLEDGSECARTEPEETVFAGAKRLAFTCAAGRFGLVGPFERFENMLLAERVSLTEGGGLEPYGTTILPVTSITLDAETPLPQIEPPESAR